MLTVTVIAYVEDIFCVCTLNRRLSYNTNLNIVKHVFEVAANETLAPSFSL